MYKKLIYGTYDSSSFIAFPLLSHTHRCGPNRQRQRPSSYLSVYFLLLENVCVSDLRLNIVLNLSTAHHLLFSRPADARLALEPDPLGRALKGESHMRNVR